MSRVHNFLVDVAHRPHIYLKWIIATLMVIGGLYILGPFYLATTVPGSTQGLLGSTLAHAFLLKGFGIAYGSSGLMTMFGLTTGRRQWTARGLFLTFLFLTFTTILVLAVNGLRPISWLQTLTIALFAAVLWIRIKWEDAGRAKPGDGHHGD